jgi:hypothetical protein
MEFGSRDKPMLERFPQAVQRGLSYETREFLAIFCPNLLLVERKAQKKRKPSKKPTRRQDNREASPIYTLTDLTAAV